jgi:hypothetical protein
LRRHSIASRANHEAAARLIVPAPTAGLWLHESGTYVTFTEAGAEPLA